MISNLDHCIPGFSNFSENLHYYYQSAYLLLATCLDYRILYVIWVLQRQIYSSQSFYSLYSIDCVASIVSMSIDVVFARIFLFFPQLCEVLSFSVRNSWVFMRVFYCLKNYLQAIKPIIHIFLALNRMSCVMFPITYSPIWTRKMKYLKLIIIFSPFLVIWNLLISDNFVVFKNGGFSISYTRNVSWASLSSMHFILIIFTVVITMITTVITFWKIRSLKLRLKSSERSLCIAAGLISIGFLLEAVTQSLYAFFKDQPWISDAAYYTQDITRDILNVGSPLVLLLSSKNFRDHVVGKPIDSRFSKKSSIEITLQN